MARRRARTERPSAPPPMSSTRTSTRSRTGSQRAAWAFVMRVAIWGTVLFVALYAAWPESARAVVCQVVAANITALGHLLGFAMTNDGAFVRLGEGASQFAVEIITECTGAFAMFVYAACVLAFPAAWSRRALGVALGWPIIYALNLVRMTVLVLVGRYAPSYFDYFHEYFWQGTFIVVVIALFIVWVNWATRATPRPEPVADVPSEGEAARA